VQPRAPGIWSHPSGFSMPGLPVRGYAYTTVLPRIADRSTVVPSVAGSETDATFIETKCDAAPSSTGAGIFDQSGASTVLFATNASFTGNETIANICRLKSFTSGSLLYFRRCGGKYGTRSIQHDFRLDRPDGKSRPPGRVGIIPDQVPDLSQTFRGC